MIGLERGTVKLLSYNPKWAEAFELEKQLLLNTFGNIIIAIEHVGSTAIPGILAKPIIDIEVGVDSMETAKKMGTKFEKLGYTYRTLNYNKKTSKEVLFVKGPENNRTHHVHVTVYDSDFWNKDLLFRDYMRQNPEQAKEYSELKRKLAEKYPNDRAKYTVKKEVFIKETLKIAISDLY